MSVCLRCGRECGYILCGECGEKIDREELIERVSRYSPASGQPNDLWDGIAGGMSDKYNFRDIAVALACDLPSPRKEYMIFRYILNISGNYNIHSDCSKWFFRNLGTLLGDGISEEEKGDVYAAQLYSLYSRQRYGEAEKAAEIIYRRQQHTYGEAYCLAEYYMRTNRYGRAQTLLENAKPLCRKGYELTKLERLLSDVRQKSSGKETVGGYMPENYGEKEKHAESAKSMQAAANTANTSPAEKRVSGRRKAADRIPKADYPDLPRFRDSGFKSFVAYDLETTGINSSFDNIVEIGAVRVTKGVITDKFQTLVRPMDRRITPEASRISGITNELVKDAPDIKTAFNAFADFIGDDILVGFNNHSFDDKFIVRAGRYAFRVIGNKSFDVRYYARDLADRINFPGSGMGLADCCAALGITNLQAHRALGDAETTAKVYLSLLEKDKGTPSAVTLDDILSDAGWE
ncbi:MAG: 3'-5' exonuclease [Ruminococcus sp.]|nr:3'-5' exonuclease [Ruminococcus sp.]